MKNNQFITKENIDFTTYNQTKIIYRLGKKNSLLVKVMQILKAVEVAYKLEFFERMLNYIRVLGIKAMSNNRQLGIFNSEVVDINAASDNSMEQSLMEFLYHFEIIEHKRDVVEINPAYKRLLEESIIKDLISKPVLVLKNGYSKEEQKLVKDFCFITDLIEKYDNPEYEFQTVKSRAGKWEELVVNRKLDYEIRLSKTFFNLTELNIPNKIKSPFDDDFYTESGRNAFKNYTRHVFVDFLREVTANVEKAKVFDLGCGYGDYIHEIQTTFPDYSVTGVELNPKVFAETASRFKGSGNIEILNEDFFNVQPKGKYDALLMNYVLFYFNREDKKKVFEKAKELLNEEGSIILCQYFSGIEELKKEMAIQQGNYNSSKQIEMYYSDKVLYANTLWNDAVDTFSEAVKWDEFTGMLSELDLEIRSMTNADKFYYSFFIEVGRK